MMKFLGIIVLIVTVVPFASAGGSDICKVEKAAAQCINNLIKNLNALTNLDATLKDLVTNLVTTLNTLIKNITGLQDAKIKDTGSALKDALNQTINDLFGIIGGILKQIMNTPNATPAATIKQLLTLVTDLVQCILSDLLCTLDGTVKNVLQIVSGLLKGLNGVLMGLSQLPTTLMTLLQPLLNALSGVLPPGQCSATDALTCVDDLVTGVGTLTSSDTALNAIIKKLGDTLGTVKTTVTSIVSGGKSTKTFETLGANVDTLLGNIVELVKYILSHISKDPKVGLPTLQAVFALLPKITDCLLTKLNCFLEGPKTVVLNTVNLLLVQVSMLLDKAATIPPGLNDLLTAIISALGKFVKGAGGK